MEQIALLSIILVIAFSEWREHKLRHRMSLLNKAIKNYVELSALRQAELEKGLADVNVKINMILNSHLAFETKQKELAEYVHKGSINLETIVQEYEINGIWLGKDRNRQPEYAYEG